MRVQHLQSAWMRLPMRLRFGLAVVWALMTLLSVPTLADGVAGWAAWLQFVGSTAAGYVFPTLGLLGLATFIGLQYGERRAGTGKARRGEAAPAGHDLAQRRLLASALAVAYNDGLHWYGKDVEARAMTGTLSIRFTPRSRQATMRP